VFDPWRVCMGFVIGKIALRHVSFRLLRFSRMIIIPLCTFVTFITYRRHIILAVDSIAKFKKKKNMNYSVVNCIPAVCNFILFLRRFSKHEIINGSCLLKN
jgi:hypothetical protein